jgi:hypothetical protein
MSSTPLGEPLRALHEFLRAKAPDTQTRADLYARLADLRRQDPEAYDTVCLPAIEPYGSWWSEPLVWSTLSCWTAYGQGLRSSRVPALDTYRGVMPFGPYQLEIESLSYYGFNQGRLLEGDDVPESFAGCCGLKIDGTTVYDGSTSQEFFEATVDSNALVSPLLALIEQLPDLRRFEFQMPSYAEQYSFQETYLRPRKVELTRAKRQALFKALRDRDALTSLTFSHNLQVKGFYGFRQKRWSRLEELDLNRNELGSVDPPDASITKLFPETMPHLRRLSLDRCAYLTDASVAALEAESSFPALEVLDVRATKITAASRRLLESSPSFPSLREVLISEEQDPRA